MAEFDFQTGGDAVIVPAPVTIKTLDLETLADRVDAIPPEAVGFYKQNCMICMHRNGHKAGVRLRVDSGSSPEPTFEVQWAGEMTDRILRAYRDTIKATDFAAVAIALLLVCELTEFTAIEQSVVGTTIDYYLGHQADADDVLIFNRKARLEASGILTENKDNTVGDRVRAKQRRLIPEDGLPDLIVVVEFGQPWSKLTRS